MDVQKGAPAAAGADEVVRFERVNSPVAVPKRTRVVLDMLLKAAAHGDPCPSNAVLAYAMDAESPATAAAAVALLEAMGVITVERGSCERCVTIVSSGARTRPLSGRPVIYRPGRKRRAAWPSQYVVETFADALAEHGNVAAAARECQISRHEGQRLLEMFKVQLGPQAA